MSMRPNFSCLICSHKLLPHLRHGDIYWFCSRCRQEMPVAHSTQSTVMSWAESSLHHIRPFTRNKNTQL